MNRTSRNRRIGRASSLEGGGGQGAILDWLRRVLHLHIMSIQDAYNAAYLCQVMDMIHPGSVSMRRVKWEARSEWDHADNVHLLQSALNKAGATRELEIQRLAKRHNGAWIELLQWMMDFYQRTVRHSENENHVLSSYDWARRRALCKDGPPVPPDYHFDPPAGATPRSPRINVPKLHLASPHGSNHTRNWSADSSTGEGGGSETTRVSIQTDRTPVGSGGSAQRGRGRRGLLHIRSESPRATPTNTGTPHSARAAAIGGGGGGRQSPFSAQNPPSYRRRHPAELPSKTEGMSGLIAWTNDLLKTQFRDIKELFPASVACILFDCCFPNSIPVSKVGWDETTEYQQRRNYEVLIRAMHKTQHFTELPVDKLCRNNRPANIQLLQWLRDEFHRIWKGRWQLGGGHPDPDYDPVARVLKCKAAMMPKRSPRAMPGGPINTLTLADSGSGAATRSTSPRAGPSPQTPRRPAAGITLSTPRTKPSHSPTATASGGVQSSRSPGGGSGGGSQGSPSPKGRERPRWSMIDREDTAIFSTTPTALERAQGYETSPSAQARAEEAQRFFGNEEGGGAGTQQGVEPGISPTNRMPRGPQPLAAALSDDALSDHLMQHHNASPPRPTRPPARKGDGGTGFSSESPPRPGSGSSASATGWSTSGGAAAGHLREMANRIRPSPSQHPPAHPTTHSSHTSHTATRPTPSHPSHRTGSGLAAAGGQVAGGDAIGTRRRLAVDCSSPAGSTSPPVRSGGTSSGDNITPPASGILSPGRPPQHPSRSPRRRVVRHQVPAMSPLQTGVPSPTDAGHQLPPHTTTVGTVTAVATSNSSPAPQPSPETGQGDTARSPGRRWFFGLFA